MNNDGDTPASRKIIGLSLREFALINFGIALVAVGVYFFKYPNNFCMGGVSGISVLLSAMLPNISTASLSAILNMILLLIGFMVFGRSFGVKTAYATTILSLEIWLMEYFIPVKSPVTGLPLLEMLYAVIFPGIGAAILFNAQASTGGTDILAMIVRKYSSLDIGKALLASDFIIALACFPVFGARTALLSLMGLFTKGIIVDSTIENLNRVKYFTIVTTHGDEVSDYVTKVLHRGATRFKGLGAYSGMEKSVILTVVNRVEAVMLRDFIKSVDQKAFIMITNTAQIIGKGFHSAF